MGIIKLQTQDFMVDAVIQKMKKNNVGCACIFVGIVRGLSGKARVKGLEFQAYRRMALSELKKLCRRAVEKFDIADVSFIHRLGNLRAGENIVLIAVTAEHRKDVFRAGSFLVEELKKLVPIWKKEIKTA